MIEKIGKDKLIFAVFILFLLILRLPTVKKGHLHFPDELRYRHAFVVIDKLNEGKIKEAITWLFRDNARPTFTLLSIIPAFAQRLLDRDVAKDVDINIDVKTDNLRLDTYAIPSILNVFFSLGVSVIAFLLFRILLEDKTLSLIAAIIFSQLNLSYMYIRHLVPYYLSLFLYLLTLYLVIRFAKLKRLSTKKIFLLGLLQGFAFSFYPGHYTIIVVVLGIILFVADKRKIITTLAFLMSFSVILLAWDILARYSGMNYLFNAKQIEAIIGTYKHIGHEAFTHGLVYIIGTEAIMGIVLFIFFFIYLVFGLFKKSSQVIPKVLFTCVIFVYFFHSIACYITQGEKYNVYSFYPYMFFVTLGCFLFIKRMAHLSRITALILLGVSIVSFCFYYARYFKINYPRDIRESIVKNYPGRKIIYTAEFYPKSLQRAALTLAIRNEYDFLGVNIRMPGRDARFEYNPLKLSNLKEILNFPQPYSLFPPYDSLCFFGEKSNSIAKFRMKIYALK